MVSEMTVNESKDTILWKIKKYTGEEQTIEINKKDSNKYQIGGHQNERIITS